MRNGISKIGIAFKKRPRAFRVSSLRRIIEVTEKGDISQNTACNKKKKELEIKEQKALIRKE